MKRMAMKRMAMNSMAMKSILTRLMAVMVLGSTALGIQPAVAQTRMVCGDRGKIISHLESKYGETRRSIGLAQGQGIFEVYASDESGTWTIVLTKPSGRTCLMAAGEAFQALAPKLVDTPT